MVSTSCRAAGPMSQVQTIFQGSLVDKDIANNLHETARKIAEVTKDCTKAEVSFEVKQNPTIDQIKQILGKEDSTEASQAESNRGSMSVTLYKYGWLSFGAAGNKVVVMTVDFKKSGF